MAFYLRKAFKTGPVRFNLSKGGIGISTGITGARIGLNRRGAYVHGGRHGVYYRKHLKSQSARSGGGSARSATASDGDAIRREASGSQTSGYSHEAGISSTSGEQVYEVQHREGQTDVFVDTGVTYPSVYSDLPGRALPPPPPKGSVGSVGLHASLGILAVAGAWLFHPAVLLLGIVPVLLMVRARLQHQRYMDAAAVFLDVLRGWMNVPPADVDGVGSSLGRFRDVDGVEAALGRFRDVVPPDYVPRFVQEWYIIAMEQCILHTLEAVNAELPSEVDSLAGVRIRLEGLFNVSPERSAEIRRALFGSELEAALEDHLLTPQEEAGMTALARVLGLSDQDIRPELDLMTIAAGFRHQMEAPLEVVDAPVPLVRGEAAFSVFDTVRLLNERVLNRYQRNRVMYRELGYETEMEGQLIVTDRRLLLLGRDGVATGSRTREYRLNRLADVISDPARNLLELVFTDRKSPVTLTAPDAMIIGAKIEQVRNQSEM
jgi:hypothetical protein